LVNPNFGWPQKNKKKSFQNVAIEIGAVGFPSKYSRWFGSLALYVGSLLRWVITISTRDFCRVTCPSKVVLHSEMVEDAL